MRYLAIIFILFSATSSSASRSKHEQAAQRSRDVVTAIEMINSYTKGDYRVSIGEGFFEKLDSVPQILQKKFWTSVKNRRPRPGYELQDLLIKSIEKKGSGLAPVSAYLFNAMFSFEDVAEGIPDRFLKTLDHEGLLSFDAHEAFAHFSELIPQSSMKTQAQWLTPERSQVIARIAQRHLSAIEKLAKTYPSSSGFLQDQFRTWATKISHVLVVMAKKGFPTNPIELSESQKPRPVLDRREATRTAVSLIQRIPERLLWECIEHLKQLAEEE